MAPSQSPGRTASEVTEWPPKEYGSLLQVDPESSLFHTPSSNVPQYTTPGREESPARHWGVPEGNRCSSRFLWGRSASSRCPEIRSMLFPIATRMMVLFKRTCTRIFSPHGCTSDLLSRTFCNCERQDREDDYIENPQLILKQLVRRVPSNVLRKGMAIRSVEVRRLRGYV